MNPVRKMKILYSILVFRIRLLLLMQIPAPILPRQDPETIQQNKILDLRRNPHLDDPGRS